MSSSWATSDLPSNGSTGSTCGPGGATLTVLDPFGDSIRFWQAG